MSERRLSVAVMGLGHHGRRIASALDEAGYQLVGAIDVKPLVGKLLNETVPGSRVPAVPILASSAELLDSTTPDVIVLAASISLEETLEHAAYFLTRGVNVVTLHEGLFEPDPVWAAGLDAAAKAGGASFLSTGVQDTWWVHMIAVAAGSTRALTEIEVTHVLDMGALSPAVAREYGIDVHPADQAGFLERWQLSPPTLGAPLRELVRRLGLTTGTSTRVTKPVFALRDVNWDATGQRLAAGAMIGMTDLVEIDTVQGVRVIGSLKVALLAEDETHSDRVTLRGDPELTLIHEPFPGEGVTDNAVINRIADVVAAPPGLLASADLPAPRYRH